MLCGSNHAGQHDHQALWSSCSLSAAVIKQTKKKNNFSLNVLLEHTVLVLIIKIIIIKYITTFHFNKNRTFL